MEISSLFRGSVGSGLRRVAFGAFAVVAFSAPFLLPSQSVDATTYQNCSGGEWVVTATAAERTAQGDCAPGYICKEWCMIFSCGANVVPTGDFQCFPG